MELPNPMLDADSDKCNTLDFTSDGHFTVVYVVLAVVKFELCFIS